MNQNNDRTIRVVSPGGHFLRRCSTKEANRLIHQLRARVGRATSKRLIEIIDVTARISDRIPGGSLSSSCVEHLGDTRSVHVQKRVRQIRTKGQPTVNDFVTWDPNLTFAELRQGRMLSERTVIERAEARAFRRTA